MPTLFRLVEKIVTYLVKNSDTIARFVTPQQLAVITAGLTAMQAILAIKDAIEGL